MLWRSITLGAYTDLESLRVALGEGGFRMSEWSRDLLTKVSLAPSRTEINLVLLSGAQLGFSYDPCLREVVESARKRGLEPCPNEVGPLLRMQYPRHPEVGSIHVVMEPIADLDGKLCMFTLEQHEDSSWLVADSAVPKGRWSLKDLWVFVLPDIYVS